MTYLITTILALLPKVLLNLITPFLGEKMLTELSERVIGAALRKVVSFTEDKTDDEIVEFIITTWEKNRG